MSGKDSTADRNAPLNLDLHKYRYLKSVINNRPQSDICQIRIYSSGINNCSMHVGYCGNGVELFHRHINIVFIQKIEHLLKGFILCYGRVWGPPDGGDRNGKLYFTWKKSKFKQLE